MPYIPPEVVAVLRTVDLVSTIYRASRWQRADCFAYIACHLLANAYAGESLCMQTDKEKHLQIASAFCVKMDLYCWSAEDSLCFSACFSLASLIISFRLFMCNSST